MEGFDDPGVYVGSAFNDFDNENENPKHQTAQRMKKKFKDFIRTFNSGGFAHVYRDQLKQNYNSGKFYLEIKVEDLRNFDDELEKVIRDSPSEYLRMFEESLREVADEITRPRRDGDEDVQDIQIIFKSDSLPVDLRQIKSSQVSQLVKIAGIVIKSSQVKSKASRVSIKCRSCGHVESDIPINPGLEGYSLPRRCSAPQTYNAVKCPLDPYLIMPDRSRCVDFQVLQLQENPEAVPAGETPRQLKLYIDRYLTDRVAPGNRVTLLGIYAIRKMSIPNGRDREKNSAGVRTPYIRVIGIDVDSVTGSSAGSMFSTDEEAEFRNFARRDDVYETIAKSIAPSIYGSLDIKKSLVSLLFGGSRKRLPDGLTRRGDINVLLLGDPGTAKSQLLKFIERVSPIGVYTSGKGSSAAGLTASINRDMVSRTFVVEGGAMVLADGGVVCIDEFDKMNEDDRVAIHEAMEQQTISIAKAGITTTLNSRCSVLAAANATHGRWDDTKGEENIDFMPTILSRFDMIFLVKDEHNEQMDMTLARHVIKVHVSDTATSNELQQGELSMEFIKRYVAYCKFHCAPRLDEEAASTLRNRYVLMRSGVSMGEAGGKKSVIPITVRQLEAVVRISESLAKLELAPFAGKKQVEEALRLFKVSTLETAQSGQLAGVEGFTSEQDHAVSNRIETQLKRRFAVGTQVSEYVVLTDFGRQGYPEHTIRRVIQFMVRRGELQHRMQRKMLYRLK